MKSETVRLNKYIALCGVCSRRNADDLIAAGRVKVNGKVTRQMGEKISNEDEVEVDGKLLRAEQKRYVLLNKPKDYICTVKDPGERKTVLDLIEKEESSERLYPVGRLDRNSTGLLLMTNDGELARSLTHPSTNVPKIYEVALNEKMRIEDFNKMKNIGLSLEDGMIRPDELTFPETNDHSKIGIKLHSGRNRIVRRMFESLGYKVKSLDRVLFANLTKKNLPRGKWRSLKENEVRLLKKYLTHKED